MTVEDELILRFSFPDGRPFFNVEAAGQYGFSIPSPTAAEEHSTGPDDQGHEWLQANPVGTGPYTVTRNDPGQEIIFEQFPQYWGGWSGDHFERVITRTIPESNTRRRLLEQGEADIIWPGTADDTVQLGEDPRFTVTDAPTLVMEFIALGAYGPLEDPRARQAMNHAFDREGYLSGVMRDTLDAPHGMFPDLLATADTSVQMPAYDLDKAKQLLDAAGVAEGTELTYTYFTGFGDDVGELLQASLAEIGIQLQRLRGRFLQRRAARAAAEHVFLLVVAELQSPVRLGVGAVPQRRVGVGRRQCGPVLQQGGGRVDRRDVECADQ
jgi:peptide/nickel transport system substrate-binding protein